MRRVLACLNILILVTALMGSAPTVRAASDLTLPDESLLADPIFARPGYEGLSRLWLGRTRYLLAIDMDPTSGVLTGRVRILFVNSSSAALDKIVLRLYQNHPWNRSDGHRMSVQSAAVNGVGVTGQLAASNTVYRVPLASPLPPGGTATLDIDYRITVPPDSFFYISEALPMLAVFSPDGGWREDVSLKGLDYTFTETALYAVRLRAPTATQTWFIGSVKKAEANADGTTTYTIVTGPVRNFAIVQARGWGTLEISGGPVPVRVLYSGSRSASEEVGNIAANAMAFYDTNFGAYPYAELDVIAMSFPSGGRELPSMVFINNARDSVYRRFITAHEVAHQWFYGLAGNDTLRSAWMGESVVQIAGYLFYKQTGYGGSPTAAEDYWASILRWYTRLQTVKPLNMPVDSFTDFNDYMSNTYGGGAVFFRGIVEQIGERAFIAGLHSYVQTVGLGVGTPLQFFSAIQAQTSVNLKPLFCQRIGIMC